MKILTEQFKKLELHKNYAINSGGCGFFALTVYDRFKPIMPELRLVSKKNNFGHGYWHVVLEHRGIRFDSEGIVTKWESYDWTFVSYKQLLFDINARDTWNDDFDRKHVPEIEVMIDNIYQKYKYQIAHELTYPMSLVLPSNRKIQILI